MPFQPYLQLKVSVNLLLSRYVIYKSLCTTQITGFWVGICIIPKINVSFKKVETNTQLEQLHIVCVSFHDVTFRFTSVFYTMMFSLPLIDCIFCSSLIFVNDVGKQIYVNISNIYIREVIKEKRARKQKK